MNDIPPSTNQCTRCIFKMEGKPVCVAFPRGIPADILSGRVTHTSPYDGDGGIRFAPLRRQRAANHQPLLPDFD
jgi:hypothetical protein